MKKFYKPHICNPSTWEAEAGGSCAQGQFGYIVSSRPTWTIEQNPVSKIQNIFKLELNLQNLTEYSKLNELYSKAYWIWAIFHTYDYQ
jgi:hypothetical protein